MKFCLLVTVALDIFIKEKNNTFIFLGFLLCYFCKRCLLGQTKRKGTLLTIFRAPRYSNPHAYYILHRFPTPLLNRSPQFIRDLRVGNCTSFLIGKAAMTIKISQVACTY